MKSNLIVEHMLPKWSKVQGAFLYWPYILTLQMYSTSYDYGKHI
jgi:hypothetical protein